MNIILKEGIDFDWVNMKHNWGYDISCPKLRKTKTILKIIREPGHNSVVYVGSNPNIHQHQNILVPALIINGCYLSNDRISNHWSYQLINEDLTLGNFVSGYGLFYKSHIDFKVEIIYKIDIEGGYKFE